MIAPVKRRRSEASPPAWHAGFLAMLPGVTAYARLAFRQLDPESRQEAVQECLANALVAYVRLVQLDKVSLAYPTVLARYAVAQCKDGRKVGNRLRIGEVLSRYAQQRKKFSVESLDKFDDEEGQWLEAVVEDPHTPVFDQVWFRCDFPAWLAQLAPRERKIALKLATNESTGQVAQIFKVSSGRISQLRKELKRAWDVFQGEVGPSRIAAASA